MKKTKEIFGNLIGLLKQLLWRDRAAAFFLYLALLLNFAAWAIMNWTLQSHQQILVLHYNSYLGFDMFVNFNAGDSTVDYFIAPLTTAMIWLFNFIVGGFLYFQGSRVRQEGGKMELKPNRRSPHYIGSMMMFGTSLVVQVALLIYAVSITLVNR